MTNLPHIIEVALLLLVAFLIGALIGYFLRCVLFRPKVEVPAPVAPPVPTPAPIVAPVAPKLAPKKPKPVVAKVVSDGRPQTLSKPRDGKKDNLKRVKGIGPKIEGILNKLGIYHFDQIAGWNRKTVGWVDDYLSFKGRIDREDWISQAKKLAKGEDTSFSKRVDKGSVATSRKKAVSKAQPKKKVAGKKKVTSKKK
jgi:NADH-quinone oxidoreductase subunit E